jgi:hypothetical protein
MPSVAGIWNLEIHGGQEHFIEAILMLRIYR